MLREKIENHKKKKMREKGFDGVTSIHKNGQSWCK